MASVLFPNPSTGPRPKTHISIGDLPPFIDPKQPPTKKAPWRQIRETPFISSVTVTLPSNLYNTLSPNLAQFSPSKVSSTTTTAITPAPSTTQQEQPQDHPPSSSPTTTYSKLILPLHIILTTSFFTNYIKLGNILLLSEGVPGVSSWHCTLHSGVLRLHLARDIYERCGLQGTPADRNSGAKKHGRDWWVVELDLRAPAMVRGKKGFERLIRAVGEGGPLADARVWLFRDLGMKGGTERDEETVRKFSPTTVLLDPEVREVKGVLVPEVVRTMSEELRVAGPPPLRLHDIYHEITEWVDLVQLESPRVLKDNTADPYISRYAVPDRESATIEDLTVVTWTGLLDQYWCTQLVIDVIRQSRRCGTDQWLSLTVNAHRTEAVGQINGFTVLLQPRVERLKSSEDEMDVDQRQTREGDESVAVEETGTTSGGFHRYICFQLVDSVTA